MTVRSWGETPELWRVLTAGTSREPANNRHHGEEELDEFDWDSLRRFRSDQEHRARAEISLARLNALLRSRQRRRHLWPLVSTALAALLVPLVALVTVQHYRHA